MEKETLCPLDCPDACSLRVEVEDGQARVVDGNRRNPVTGGYICAKVRQLPAHVHGEARIPVPGFRVGGKGQGRFEQTSWDAALERIVGAIAAAVRDHGSASVLPFCYGGSNGMLTQSSVDARFFRRLGASRLARTVCAAPTTAAATAMYGKMPGVAYQDYVHADLVVIWGANPGVSGIHLMPYLQEARDRGARMVVVDPRRTKLARQADLHLPVRPGTDVALALAVIDWLFAHDRADREFLEAEATGVERLREAAARWSLEEAAEVTGVEVAKIRRLAEWYADAEPAVIRAGWGMERNRNGGSSVAAVLALPAVAGKFGVRGGGYTMSNSGAFSYAAAEAARADEPETRTINMNRLGRALLEARPPVKVLFVYNCNPVATMPDQERVIAGLEREDLFTVVFDSHHTDTADYADVVLPATTFLEHAELRAGYGAMVLQASRPVIDPVGLSRPNYEVFADLCRRMGLEREGDPTEPADLVEAIVGGNGRAERLLDGEVLTPEFGATPIQLRDVHSRTPDGKIHLFPAELDAESPGGLYSFAIDPATDAHPLALISPATKHTISSTLGQLHDRPATLQIHPRDAAFRNVDDGDEVRIFNDLGEVRVPAKLTEEMRPGVVYLPKGLWARHTLNGRTSNALVPDDLTDVAGGACFNDARVEVERV